MTKIRKANERGHADHGWLDSWHTFSFANYHDPAHMGFRSLRVINDDVVHGGTGFDMHPHRDMEIVTYVIQGALQHRDSMGNTAVMKRGDVQRISAGKGILHSEHNYSPIEPVRLLQIWIQPDQRGVTPAYAERSFKDATTGQLHLVTSRTGREGSVQINQDVDLLLAKFEGKESVSHLLRPGRAAWVQVAEGSVNLNGQKLDQGDGAAITGESALELQGSGQPAQVLLFDLN